MRLSVTNGGNTASSEIEVVETKGIRKYGGGTRWSGDILISGMFLTIL